MDANERKSILGFLDKHAKARRHYGNARARTYRYTPGTASHRKAWEDMGRYADAMDEALSGIRALAEAVEPPAGYSVEQHYEHWRVLRPGGEPGSIHSTRAEAVVAALAEAEQRG